MTLSELDKNLKAAGISADRADRYYLHGLYGSTEDNDKLSLTIRRGKYFIEYQIYYRERGEKNSVLTFTNENEALNYFYNRMHESWTLEKIERIEGLNGMTVNERLYASGLMNEFDKCIVNDKTKARQILRWLHVDEPSINKIIV